MKFVHTRDILGVKIATLSERDALAFINEHVTDRAHLKLAFCNAHTAMLAAKNVSFRACLGQFMVLTDGIGVDLGSRVLYGAKFPANLNGTDFVPHLLEAAQKPLSVMLLGGRPGVAQNAAATLARHMPQHSISVLNDGFFDAEKERDILVRLQAANPDVLLVALGNPLQEKWIAQNCTSANCGIAIGVGALFDFLAGEVTRAPAFVRRARLEWLWRLSQEPVRLFRRYVLGIPEFVARIGGAWLVRKLHMGHTPAG